LPMARIVVSLVTIPPIVITTVTTTSARVKAGGNSFITKACSSHAGRSEYPRLYVVGARIESRRFDGRAADS
jgi:hypothetical protein